MAQNDTSISHARTPERPEAPFSDQQSGQQAANMVQDSGKQLPNLPPSSTELTAELTAAAPQSVQSSEHQDADSMPLPSTGTTLPAQPVIAAHSTDDQAVAATQSEQQPAQQPADIGSDSSHQLLVPQVSSGDTVVEETAGLPEPEAKSQQQPADLVHDASQEPTVQQHLPEDMTMDQPTAVSEPVPSVPADGQHARAPEQDPTGSEQTSETADGPHVEQEDAQFMLHESGGPLASVSDPANSAQLPDASLPADKADSNDARVADAPKASSDDSDSSDPLSSSSDDSDSDSDSNAPANAADAMSDIDVEDGDVDDLESFVRGVMSGEGKSGPEASLRTANEDPYWTAFSVPKIEVTEKTEIAELGIVTSFIDGYAAVIDPSFSNVPGILDMGTPICTRERKLLGEIGDVIATVKTPRYVWGVNDPSEFEKHGITVNDKLFYVKGNATWVNVPALKQQKGYDASNMNDEEIPNDKQDFSDDEAERQFKHAKKNRKRTHESATPSNYGGSILNYDDGGSVAEDDDDGSYRKLKRPAPGMMDRPPPPLPGRGMPGGRGPRGRGGRGGNRDERRGGHTRRGPNNGHSNGNSRGDASSVASQSPRPVSQNLASAPFPNGQPYMGQGYSYNNGSPGMQSPGTYVPPPPGWPHFNPAGGMPGFVPAPPSMAGGFTQMPSPQMMAMHPYYTIPGPWNNHTLPQQQNQPYPPWWNNANNGNQNNNGGQQ